MMLNWTRRLRMVLIVKHEFEGGVDMSPTTSVEPEPPGRSRASALRASNSLLQPKSRTTQQYNYFFAKLYPFFLA